MPRKLVTVLTGGCYDRNFKYTPANRTDITKTFDRLVPGWRKIRPCPTPPTPDALTVSTAEQTTSSPPVIET